MNFAVLQQHFVVDEPVFWQPGDKPRIDFDDEGRVIRFVKVSPSGRIVPVIGHVLWTTAEPPPLHLTFNGVIMYASFNVEHAPIPARHLDIIA